MVGGFAAVCFAGAGAFVFDVADGQPQQLDDGVVAGEVATVLDLCPLRDGLWLSPGEVDLASALEPLGEELPGNAVLAFHARELLVGPKPRDGRTRDVGCRRGQLLAGSPRTV